MRFISFPISIENQSVEVPNSNGARQSTLAPLGGFLEYIHEDTKTLIDVFRKGQELSNDGPCLGWRDSDSCYKWLSYGEVMEKSKNISYGLVHAGMKRGQDSRIGIYSKNSVEWVLIEQACYLQSAILVPLYDTFGPDACKFVLNKTEAEFLICDSKKKLKTILDAKEDIPNLRHIVVVVEVDKYLKTLATEKGIVIHQLKDIEESGRQKPGTFMLPGPTDLATICFTSGTTGTPKGVMLEHGQIVIGVDSVRRNIGIEFLGVGDRMISYLPSAHLFDRLCQLMMYSCGGSVGFFRGDKKLLYDDINTLKPTFLPGVPRVFNRIFDKMQNQFRWNPLKRLLLNIALSMKHAELESGIIRDDSVWDRIVLKNVRSFLGGEVRFMLSTGAPLRRDILTFFRCCMGCPVVEAYGQTEACVVSWSVIGDNEAGYVGPPLPCCFIKLKDVPEMGYYAKNGEGEILIKGPAVMRGYFKDPEKTAEVLDKDGWLHSGDVGRWEKKGVLSIIDRKKNLLKLSQGEYISPEKVEAVYSFCPYVEQIFVHGDSLEDFLVAIVVPKREALLPWCSQQKIQGEWDEICENEEVKEFILKELYHLGAKSGLKGFEQVKAIHLHAEGFSQCNGLLTVTMKVRRLECRKRFKETMRKMYDDMRKKYLESTE